MIKTKGRLFKTGSFVVAMICVLFFIAKGAIAEAAETPSLSKCAFSPSNCGSFSLSPEVEKTLTDAFTSSSGVTTANSSQEIIRNNLPAGKTDLYRTEVPAPGLAAFVNATKDWVTRRDMLVMYGGEACDQRVPEIDDHKEIMAGISNGTLPTRTDTGVLIKGLTFYYDFSNVMNQSVKIGGRVNRPPAPAGCYYVLIYNVSSAPSDYSFTFSTTSATTSTFTISGTVSGLDAGANATIDLSGKATMSTTTVSGAYSFTGLLAGNYTVTPSLSGYEFTPANKAVAINSANVTDQNFTGAVSSATFNDVPSGYWAENYIYSIFDAGITSGCYADDPNTLPNEAAYCPDNTVTRGQMAVFVVKALGEQPAATCTGTVFNDVNANMNGGDDFCKFVEKFKELNITSGCGNNNYCPDDPVTRAQMAVFIVTALAQQPAATCTGTVFNDVNANMNGGDGFCKFIEKFKELNITSGCGDNNYCPDESVTRAQMAVFLTKGFLQ